MSRKSTLALLCLLAAPTFASAQTVQGTGSADTFLDVKARVGSACVLQAPETVALSPTLYWTNPQDASGTLLVNVRCNLSTQFALSAPANLALTLGDATLDATLTGGTEAATAGADNAAATSSGQNYAFEINVAAGQLDVSRPSGTYTGSTLITLQLLGPADPDDGEICPVFGPITPLYTETAQ